MPSDTVLVSTTAYNDRGEAYCTTDPAGRQAWQIFDDAGRTVAAISNYVTGTFNAAYPDQDVTVQTTYTPDGQVATLTAVNPTTGNQVTRYVYGSTICESAIARSDLLRAVIYPDSDDSSTWLGDGPDGIYDRVEYTYDRQGERVSMRDQNETLHVYDYDGLGRQVQDRVVKLGAGVNGRVRRIATTYDQRGRQSSITSYTHPCVGGGTIVNQVVTAYNDLNQVVAEYQAHQGAVDMQSTPAVQYVYQDPFCGSLSASAGYVLAGPRLVAMIYPNGRVLHYGYNSGADDILNRVSFLAESPLPLGRGQG